MDDATLLTNLSHCVEFGKVNKEAKFPPDMQGQNGADELTKEALDRGIKPRIILDDALISAMDRVGDKFSRKEIFVPQMLVAAKAMNAAMEHLKPYFQSGEVQRKGTLIIGTVSGDLHDIGKNLVAMIVEGAGWEVIDLGVDVSAQKFLQTLSKYQNAVIGLSALLTTTMHNMKQIVQDIREAHPETKLVIGGAPVSNQFKEEIGADGYAPDPQGAVTYLNSLVA